ncbi:MAG: hypothetical protein ACK5LV_00265 [Lachnospirales bacterium]
MKKNELFIGCTIFFLLCVFGLMYDDEMYRVFYNNGSLLHIVVEAFCQLPSGIVACLSSAIILRTNTYTNDFKGILTIILSFFMVIIILYGSFVVCYEMYHYLGVESDVISIATSSVIIGVTYAFGTNIDMKNAYRFRKIAWLGIATVFTAFLIIGAFKLVWGYDRYQALGVEITWYTLMFPPNTTIIGESFDPFPTGHTSHACIVLWFTYLPYVYTKYLPHINKIKVISIAWIVVTMVGRLASGLQFFSSVSRGAFITFALFWIFKELLNIDDEDLSSRLKYDDYFNSVKGEDTEVKDVYTPIYVDDDEFDF